MYHDPGADALTPLLGGRRGTAEYGARKGFDATEGEATNTRSWTPPVDDESGIRESSAKNSPQHQHTSNGVAEIEALATVWSTKTLYTGYALAFFILFVNSLQQETTGTLSPYVYSAFKDHSLMSTTSMLTSVVGGIAKLPTAKLIDVWGRPEGFLIMTLLCTLGLVLMAACRNVETYAVAQILYWIGFNGMDYVLHVFLSDTTSLVNRAFVYGIASTPYLVTTFIGPAAAQQFYKHGELWWGFGTFAVITPVVATPILVLFWATRRKASKEGLIAKRGSGRSWTQSMRHYFIEFDTIGMILITTGFVLVLLPLTLATSSSKWNSTSIVTMMIIGGWFFVVFALWERFYAPVCVIPFELLADRTLLGACLLSCTLFASFYSWDLYLTSYLQVAFGTNMQTAGYITNIYSIGSCFWSVPLGIFIRKVGRLKWTAMAAMPLILLGSGLMIYFRNPHSKIRYVIICEILKAFGGGTIVICQEMAAMATGSHETIAVSFALVGLFSKLGASIGSAISGAIWVKTVPEYLERYLPAEKKSEAAELFGSVAAVLKYQVGTPTREAVVHAYGVAQRRMLIAGVTVLPMGVLAISMWKDIRLKQSRQIKGNTF